MMSDSLSIMLPAVVALGVVAALAVTSLVVVTLLGRRVLRRLGAIESMLDDAIDATDGLAETVDAEVAGLRSGVRQQLRRTERIGRQVEQLAVDIVRRDACLIEAPTQRSNLIDVARGGHGVEALVHDHGLSADEAELLVLLHGDGVTDVEKSVR